jgi:hypothetical protein
MRLLACPICGKYPKVVDSYSDETRVECIPRGYFGIRKNAHMIVFGRNVLDAVAEWNKEVKKFWEAKDE